MTEVKIQVDDELLATVGQEQLEHFLREMIEQLQLKAAARDALESLRGIDLASDLQWKQAREAAWKKHVQPSSDGLFD